MNFRLTYQQQLALDQGKWCQRTWRQIKRLLLLPKRNITLTPLSYIPPGRGWSLYLHWRMGWVSRMTLLLIMWFCVLWSCDSVCFFTVIMWLVNDWDLYQKLLDHLLSRHIKTTANLHPILITEPAVSLVVIATCTGGESRLLFVIIFV